MNNNFQAGYYRHFKQDENGKHKFYCAHSLAEHTETGEAMVVYQAMYPPYKSYVRPAVMFFSPTDKEKYPDAVQDARLQFFGDVATEELLNEIENPELSLHEGIIVVNNNEVVHIKSK